MKFLKIIVACQPCREGGMNINFLGGLIGNDSNDLLRILCMHHKMGTSGLAYLVITEEIEEAILVVPDITLPHHSS